MQTDPILRGFCGTLLDGALSATSRRCPIVLTCADDLPDTILADESLLRHVFSNLLSNAAKYSPEGSPAHLTVEKTAPDTITFRIADQGIGIPAADLPRLFQPFQRAGNVGQISGTGLGLMIAKRCAELHSGTLEVAEWEMLPGMGDVAWEIAEQDPVGQSERATRAFLVALRSRLDEAVSSMDRNAPDARKQFTAIHAEAMALPPDWRAPVTEALRRKWFAVPREVKAHQGQANHS